MDQKFSFSPSFKVYEANSENLIKLAITHNYVVHASLPDLDNDYPAQVRKWARNIIKHEDLVFDKNKPFINQTNEAKQDKNVSTLVIGNTMHVLDFLMGYFFTHKKGNVYTILGEIGPYDDIIYSELLSRDYIEDYNIRYHYDSNQDKTLNLIKQFCLINKVKKIYIMINEEDYKFIKSYLEVIDKNCESLTTVFVQKDFKFEAKNPNVRIVDFNIDDTLVEASYEITNKSPIYSAEFPNDVEYLEIKEDKSEHINYFNPSWGAQYLLYKYGDKKVISKATLISKASCWEKIFSDNLLK